MWEACINRTGKLHDSQLVKLLLNTCVLFRALCTPFARKETDIIAIKSFILSLKAVHFRSSSANSNNIGLK